MENLGDSVRTSIPCPDAGATRAELEWLKRTTAELDTTAVEQVKYWNAGAPVYRWMDMLERRITSGEVMTPHPHRPLAYVALAMYDAMVAAWESKYSHSRPRPSGPDPSIRTLVAVPDSPFYPSEHAAAAAAGLELGKQVAQRLLPVTGTHWRGAARRLRAGACGPAANPGGAVR